MTTNWNSPQEMITELNGKIHQMMREHPEVREWVKSLGADLVWADRMEALRSERDEAIRLRTDARLQSFLHLHDADKEQYYFFNHQYNALCRKVNRIQSKMDKMYEEGC